MTNLTGGALVRGAVRRLQRLALASLATPLGEDELRRPAMVFAPHPDDETLGCGGTLLRKWRLEAPVRIAFLTDGSASHEQLLSRAEMSAVRVREALEAAEALGVGAPHVSWLGFPDGALAAHHEEAVSKVAALLEQHRPEQLFLPYAPGEHLDHVATNAIVHQAVRQTGLTATLLEYPVWYWRHWPHTGFGASRQRTRAVLVTSLRRGLGLRLLAEFRTSVPIRDLVDQKRAALARHASQVQRRNGDPRWPVLGDVDGGEFLACFFQDHEVFRRLEVGPGTGAGAVTASERRSPPDRHP